MNEITVSNRELPSDVSELSRFVLIGRDRLAAVRAAIRAIDKVGVASEVYRQKLGEAQEIAEAVLDAEVRLGELRKGVQRDNSFHGNQHNEVISVRREITTSPLKQFDESAILDKHVAAQVETMASHPDIVEQTKAKARENGEIVTRKAVLDAIRAEKKADEIRNARESIAKQTAKDPDAPVLHIGDSIGVKLSEKVDLLLTDPPYSTDVDDIESFVNEWLPPALENVKDTGFAYVFVGAYPDELKAYLNVKIPEHMKLEQILCWTYKNTLGNNPKDRYKQNYQAVLFFRGKNAPPLNCPLTSEQWAVQEINAPDGRQGDRFHKWQKPEELAERFIRHSTEKGMSVYDPFACTGTFLTAASKLGRRAVGFEIDEEAAKIAFKRGCVKGDGMG